MCVMQNIWNYVGFFENHLKNHLLHLSKFDLTLYMNPPQRLLPNAMPAEPFEEALLLKGKKKSYIQRIETWEMKYAVNRFPDPCVLLFQFSYAPSLMLVLLLSLLLYLVLLPLVRSLYRCWITWPPPPKAFTCANKARYSTQVRALREQ